MNRHLLIIKKAMMNKNIRLACANELPQIAFLDRRVNKTSWGMIQYEECLVNKNHKIYVLEINHDICGFVVIAVNFDEVEILQLGIDAKYQNQGLATFLLTEVLSRLDKQYIIGKVFLEVTINNFPAIALYKKMGFTQISARKDYYIIGSDKFDALIMMLDYAKS
jgi:ribosomal-protein-alanine N-acetyltransferase